MQYSKYAPGGQRNKNSPYYANVSPYLEHHKLFPINCTNKSAPRIVKGLFTKAQQSL